MTRLYQLPDEAELVTEFLRAPKGPHSPELQAYIKSLLGAPAARNIVIVNLVPFRTWALARLPDRRLGSEGDRIVIERERLFDSEEDAVRALFIRRRQALGL